MASASRALRLARLPAAACYDPSPPWLGASSPAHARFLATSSLRDSSPSWNNRPPNETILLDGCDFEHWLVIMDPDVPREEIIDGYIKTLAKVLGCEEEARQKIYSVSTRYYFAFGALVPEELSYKIKELPNVRWVLPDSYLDVKNKDYGGEPFINGEAVPYDSKYHEEWVRNNARANERSKRNDRPRSFDRSRNFERRRENVQNFQNRDASLGQGFNNPPPPFQQGMSPNDAPPMHPAQSNTPPPPPPNAGAQPTYQHHASNPQAGYAPGAPGYRDGPPGYQGGNQGYKASTGGNMHGGPGPAYQSNPRYQGGSGYPSSSQPPPPFQGGGQPPYQSGNSPPYQGGGQPPYQSGSSPPYQGGGQPPYQSGSSPPYQGGRQPPYQSGSSPPYQGGNPNHGGATSYQGQPGNPSYQGTGAPPYEGRDGPGRNYQ